MTPPFGTRARRLFHSRALLFLGFAFAVMADPVSSVAYAIEAALRALRGDLGVLLPTMVLVVGIIGIVVANYQQIVARYPRGGGAAAAVGEAFGADWAFLPLGALIVDFALTIAISAAAAASAVIAYLPGVAGDRVIIAVALLSAVAGLSWFGHGGRLLFATMTLAFVVVAAVMLVSSFGVAAPLAVRQSSPPAWDVGRLVAVMLAFPVAMALATGVEAPSSAIAQLGGIDDTGRRWFGRWTLWLTLIVVGSLTLALTAASVRLGNGIPAANATQLAELARRSAPGIIFALFQLTSATLLLAAASSSFQAGPGLLKALARGRTGSGILPEPLGRTNRHHTPVWGVLVFLLASGGTVVAAGGRDQELVLFYAVAVFISFLAGLAAMARLDWTEGRIRRFPLNVVGLVLVAFTLAVNLARGQPVVSLAASIAIALALRHGWIRAGRPAGLAREAVPE